MTDHYLDKKEVAATELKHFSKAGTVKKDWQTPKLLELDYNETNNGGAAADDGIGLS